ncbi:MAG TPA: GGDEF domain-containing protein [Pirellulales bacterium]|nr:GGDEF domain-containing protein [Pirellulales bacterium]
MPLGFYWLDRLGRWPRPWLYALFAISTLLVATADYFSGERYTVYVLYFPIVALGCWLLGMRAAVVLSFFASILWIADDVLSPPEPMPYLAKYWQAGMRFIVFVAFAYMLTRLRTALARERFLSRYDELTGLANRASLFESGQRDVARCRRAGRSLTAVFIDLDEFKRVNDTYGHAEGDKVLQVVAETIRQTTRESDISARIGGDEFVVISPDMTFDDAERYISRLQEELKRSMRDHVWPVTFSIGVATFLSPPPMLDDIVKIADDLMYVVKRRAKNAVKHTLVDGCDSSAHEQTKLETMLA